MTGQLIYILFVTIVITDLAYSTPKFQRRKIQTNNLKKNWPRQGLPESVESTESPFEDENNNEVMKDDEINDDQSNEASERSDYANDVIYENSGSSPENNSQQADNNELDNSSDDDSDLNENRTQDNDSILDRSMDENDDSIIVYLDQVENDYHQGKMDFSHEYIDLTSAEDSNENENLRGNTRLMQVGDTFTAQEMLPIAKKLMMKVGTKGEGKGIISSVTKPKNLADNLFERFFLTMKRIVILNDDDISGLDALQALASGDGEHIGKENPTRTSHYKPLRKRIQGDGRKNALRKNSKRRRVDLAKNLSKNRKLVVNPSRRVTKNKNHKHQKLRQLNKNIVKTSKKNIRSSKDYRGNIKRTQINKTSINNKVSTRDKIGATRAKKVCSWRYECKNKADLDSCRLHTDCSQDVIPARKKGEDDLDEEVEKILQRRFLALRPQKLSSSQEIENLADYFNKIVIGEQLDGNNTTPEPLETTIDISTLIPIEDFKDSVKQEDSLQLDYEHAPTPEPSQDADATETVAPEI